MSLSGQVFEKIVPCILRFCIFERNLSRIINKVITYIAVVERDAAHYKTVAEVGRTLGV